MHGGKYGDAFGGRQQACCPGHRFVGGVLISGLAAIALPTTDGQKEIAQLHADVKIARSELGEAMHEPTIKQADVNKAVDKLNTARSKMTTIRVNNMVEMSKILTPEQREKMKEMRPAGRGRRGGWGMRHRGGMGRGMGGELGIDHSSGRI